MTEEHREATVEQAQSSAPDANNSNNKKSGKQKKSKAWLAWLLLLLVVIAAAVVGWCGWQAYQQMQAEQQQGQQALQNLQQTQAANQQQLQGKNRQLAAQLARLQEQVLLQGQQLSSLDKAGEMRWLLNEAKSLASLAGQRLLLTADLSATLKLLKASDATLAQIDDPDVLVARRALAADMQKLRAARQVDTSAILLRLGALQSQLDQLTLPEKTAKTSAPKAQTEKSKEDKPSWWQRLLGQLPVELQRYEEELPLPLAASQLAQVRLSLGMNLQQAQLALLQVRPQGYQQALQQASATLERYFASEEPVVSSLAQSLDQLMEVNIDQALPQIGAGLEAIKFLLQPQTALQPQAPGAADSKTQQSGAQQANQAEGSGSQTAEPQEAQGGESA